MKKFFRLTALLMIAGGVITLSAQTVTVHYMKVNPGMEDAYRQVEQETAKLGTMREMASVEIWQLQDIAWEETED